MSSLSHYRRVTLRGVKGFVAMKISTFSPTVLRVTEFSSLGVSRKVLTISNALIHAIRMRVNSARDVLLARSVVFLPALALATRVLWDTGRLLCTPVMLHQGFI